MPHSAGGASTFPPSGPSRHQVLTAQNVQRGLAAEVQDLSGAFRKKQRVYMQSERVCISHQLTRYFFDNMSCLPIAYGGPVGPVSVVPTLNILWRTGIPKRVSFQ